MLMYTRKLTDAAKNAVKNNDSLNAAGNFEYEVYEEGIEKLSAQLKEDIANAESDYDPTLPTFYVSNNGDDSNDGMSPETAWKPTPFSKNFPSALKMISLAVLQSRPTTLP